MVLFCLLSTSWRLAAVAVAVAERTVAVGVIGVAKREQLQDDISFLKNAGGLPRTRGSHPTSGLRLSGGSHRHRRLANLSTAGGGVRTTEDIERHIERE